jgi:cytidine deaminase
MKSEAKRQRAKGRKREEKAVALSDLIAEARRAASRAYAPYSRFRVGAALRTKSGLVFAGANVENASYGLTICAERVAIFKAVSAGEREFTEIVIYTPTKTLTTPCGACRQVMSEFAPNLKIILVNRAGRTQTRSLHRLLPNRFSL